MTSGNPNDPHFRITCERDYGDELRRHLIYPSSDFVIAVIGLLKYLSSCSQLIRSTWQDNDTRASVAFAARNLFDGLRCHSLGLATLNRTVTFFLDAFAVDITEAVGLNPAQLYSSKTAMRALAHLRGPAI